MLNTWRKHPMHPPQDATRCLVDSSPEVVQNLWSKQLFFGIHGAHHGLQAACSLENRSVTHRWWFLRGSTKGSQSSNIISCLVQWVQGEILESDFMFFSRIFFQSLYITSAVQATWPWSHSTSGLVASPPLRFFFCPLQLRNKRAGGVAKDGSFFSLLVKHLDRNLYQQILNLAMISWGNGRWRLSPAIANNPTNY